MNSLDTRVEQLERKVVQLENTVRELKEANMRLQHRPSERHKRSPIPSPERAIQRARRENSLLFEQGVKIAATTVAICAFIWGGMELFEKADHYLSHQGNGLPDPLIATE